MRPARSSGAAAPSIDIQVQSPLWSAQPGAEQTVRDAVAAASATLSAADGEVSIVLTDDLAMQTLNRTWRGIDKPTNVLSFPATASAGKKTLGDIVVAFETLRRECSEDSKEFLHHLAHLTVHGFLHLRGYDHQTDAAAGDMERLESKIMACMNIPDPYRVREPG